MITRISLANEIDEYDQQIADMNSGKKDCFDAYRQQLIDCGMEKTAIKVEIEAVKAAIKRRRAAAKDEAALEEKDALVDEIFAEITRRSMRGAHAREIVGDFDVETGEVFDTRPPRKAAEAVSERAAINHEAEGNNDGRGSQQHVRRTDGEQRGAARVSHSDGRGEGADEGDQGQGAGASGPDRSMRAIHGVVDRENKDGRSRHVGGEARHEITQSDDDAISEVNGKAGLENAVGVETSSSDPIALASHGEAEAPAPKNVSLPVDERSGEGANTGGDHVDPDHSHAATAGTRINHIVPATPGITFEECPPKPMKRLPFAHCFPELTKSEYDQLSALIEESGVEEPIIRSGDTIIDGWNRYSIARSLGIAYPVKQFEGGDILSFVIAAQRSARDWLPSQERKIAAALCKELPHRANDIMAAFHIEEEFA